MPSVEDPLSSLFRLSPIPFCPLFRSMPHCSSSLAPLLVSTRSPCQCGPSSLCSLSLSLLSPLLARPVSLPSLSVPALFPLLSLSSLISPLPFPLLYPLLSSTLCSPSLLFLSSPLLSPLSSLTAVRSDQPILSVPTSFCCSSPRGFRRPPQPPASAA